MNTLPTINFVKTGQRIKQLREESGMSVADLQEAFGFTTPQAIYKWQWGKCLPEVQNLLALCDLWHV